MQEAWTNIEIDLILSDYFAMLIKELAGHDYNKAEHRRALIQLLNNRSEGSIEFKHQNISAVLANLGQPFIRGYKPRYNYQRALEDKVLDYLIGNKSIDRQFDQFSELEVTTDFQGIDFSSVLEIAPKIDSEAKDPVAGYEPRRGRTNYLWKEQSNAKLGYAGEYFALEYEKWQLIRIGKENLADKVEWVSQTQGDGLGFDILSRNTDGTDKYIEVKTTKLSKEAPFYFSKNEMHFSVVKDKDFHLYRVFEFDRTPKLFTINGSLEKVCRCEVEIYKGFF